MFSKKDKVIDATTTVNVVGEKVVVGTCPHCGAQIRKMWCPKVCAFCCTKIQWPK